MTSLWAGFLEKSQRPVRRLTTSRSAATATRAAAATPPTTPVLDMIISSKQGWAEACLGCLHRVQHTCMTWH